MREPSSSPTGFNSHDKCCERFEAAWKARPRIADFFGSASEDAQRRQHLLRDLLLLDLRYRRERGETPSADDYLREFPSDSQLVQSILEESDRAPLSTTKPWAPMADTARMGEQAEASRLPTWSAERFRILRKHASGGLGDVFLAYDREFGREVALKRIQPPFLDRASSRRRFALEAEVTGQLEHPGIVPVYSLGAQPDGTPFYAMRFIQGESLQRAIERFHNHRRPSPEVPPPADDSTQRTAGQGAAAQTVDVPAPYALENGAARNETPAESSTADFRSLEFRQLLQRFIGVCQGAAYAHSRGVLHRDIKPANVMLGEYGETLLVDWGLARRTDRGGSPDKDEKHHSRSGEQDPQQTEEGMVAGTPAYMSPEQAAGKIAELGPASDIYSLGATLYQLLTGRTPTHGAGIRQDAIVHVHRGEFASVLAVNSRIPKPLAAVSAKAMQPSPRDRYESAQGLAADLERWLADEAVAAHPESVLARGRRWVRKHPKQMAAGLATLLVGLASLAAGLGIVSQKNQELARLNEDLSNSNGALTVANQKEQQARGVAESRLTQVENGNEILGSIFADLDPDAEEQGGRPLRVILGDRLDQAVAQLEGESVGDPLAVARLQHILGRSQIGLGFSEKAIVLLEQARRTFRDRQGPDDLDALQAMGDLARAYQEAGQLQEALPLHAETLELARAKLGFDHPDSVAFMNNLALAYQDAGRLEEALPLIERAMELTSGRLGPDHPHTLLAMNNLARTFHFSGQYVKARELHERTWQLTSARLGPDHPDTLTAMNSLAMDYQAAGQFAKALELVEQALELTRAKRGATHPDALSAMNNLATVCLNAGQLERGLALSEETAELRRVKLGAGHPDTLRSMSNLATAYKAVGQLDRAVRLFEQTLELTRAKLGADHPNTLIFANNLALAYQEAGHFDKALPLHLETLEATRAKLGADHPDTLTSMNNLALAYEDAGQLEQALSLHAETLKLRREKLGPDHRDTLRSTNNLAAAYQAAGRLEEALPLLETTLQVRRATLGPDHPDTLTSMNNLAMAYQLNGQVDKALPLHESTLELLREKLGPDHPNALSSMNNLAGAYQAAGRLDKALPLFELALAQRREKLGEDHPDAIRSLGNLAAAYRLAGEIQKALPLFERTLELKRGKLGPDHPDTLATIGDLALAYLAADRLAEATGLVDEWVASQRLLLGSDNPRLAGLAAQLGVECLKHEHFPLADKLLRDCVRIRELQAPDDWSTFNAQSMLGEAIAGQARQLLATDAAAAESKFAEAEPLLLAGCNGLRERSQAIPEPVRATRLSEAVGRLVNLYTAWGKADEATRWRSELEAAPHTSPQR